jgi:glycosyltransferase involved in cell wall biosynthesis
MDVSVILNAHREGVLAQATCTSLERAKDYAEALGLSVEVITVLDRPDRLTTEFFENRIPRSWTMIETQHGDLGFARNEGVRVARGRYVAFLDADDLFTEKWIAKACSTAEKESRNTVWHSHYNVYFGGTTPRVFEHIDMDDVKIDISKLMCANFWTALSFAPRRAYEQVPYGQTRLDLRIGYEDWSWNQAVAAEGYIHKVVKDTVHFIRQKSNLSLLARTSQFDPITRPNNLFLGLIAERSARTAPMR